VETLSDALQNFKRLYEELRGECEKLQTELCPCGFGIMISTPGFCHNFEVGFGINLSDMDFPDVRLPEMGLALLEEAWSWAKA
jgi:hypothetical protein